MPAPSSISGSAPAIVGLIEEVFPMNDHPVFLAAIVLTQLNGLSCHMSHYLAPATYILTPLLVICAELFIPHFKMHLCSFTEVAWT